MGLQFSMLNIADLLKYVVTMILSQPQQFRWAALISFIAVCSGVATYAVRVQEVTACHTSAFSVDATYYYLFCRSLSGSSEVMSSTPSAYRCSESTARKSCDV